MAENNIVLAIDLELNKENEKTTDIVQLGACVGDVYTGQIIETLSAYVRIDKSLDPFINTLTGITDNVLQTEGTTLLEAYDKLKNLHIKYNTHKSIVEWGSGDSRTLKQQLIEQGLDEKDWIGGWRVVDVKTIVQAIATSKKQKVQGGLAKSLTRYGLNFSGIKHNAEFDSINTFRLYVELLKRLQNV